MSSFQKDNEYFMLLERLIRLYNEEFLSKHNEETQRVNPTGSETNTTRRDESDSKIVSFEKQTLLRAKKFLLKDINYLISKLEQIEFIPK